MSDFTPKRTKTGNVGKPRRMGRYRCGEDVIGYRCVQTPCGRSDDEWGTAHTNPTAMRAMASWFMQAAAWVEECPKRAADAQPSANAHSVKEPTP